MIFIWLLLWWMHHFPALHQWNEWLVGLIVCAALDVLGGRSAF